jgi:hypothetical protein
MFSNFKKAFKKKEINKEIPQEIIDLLNEKLPKGFKYQQMGEGVCAKVPIAPGAKITVQLDTKNLPKEIRTAEKLMEFMYRTQESITILPDKDGCITVNDTKLKIDELIETPLKDKKLKECKMSISPPPFPPPFIVPIKVNGIRKDISFQRYPYADMQKSLFRNTDNGILKLSYLINEENRSMNFSFNIEIEKAENIAQILEALRFYEAFQRNDFKIAGMEVTKITATEEEQAIIETINFWERIYELEKVLGNKFVPEFPITQNVAERLEQLYRSFVEKKPYKEYVDINSITTSITGDVQKKAVLSPTEAMFYYLQKEPEPEFILWGIKISLYSVVGIFDLRVRDIVLLNKRQKKYKLITEPTTEQGSYISILYFLTEEEAINYKFDLELFKNAELIKL